MAVADEATVELRDVYFAHPRSDRPTLSGVDLHIEAGDMLALIGPSGSGKTSTLRILSGLEQPDRGDVLVAGVSQLGVAPERRAMSMMFQRPLLFPHLNVVDNVAFSGRVSGAARDAARDRALAFLELVHLPEFALRRTQELSGGQEQRVALARALAASPRVLLLDEPFSALDPGVRADMHDLLAEVRAVLEPTTVMVTHDLDEAALADRVAVLVDGTIHQMGTVAALYRRPASLAVARVLGGFSEVDGQITAGAHRSVFGEFPLTRQELEQVADPASARRPGAQAATLLVRREALRTTAIGDPSAMFTATVNAVRQRGPVRTVVVVPEERHADTRSARLELEVDARVRGSSALGRGVRVGVARTEIPVAALHDASGTAGPDASQLAKSKATNDSFGLAVAAATKARSRPGGRR